jgi:hypothetical protein
MLIKRILAFIFLLGVGSSSVSQPVVQPFNYEVTTLMLTWKSIHQDNLGIPKLPGYKAWSKDFAVNDPLVQYAEVDLNSDGVKEIIVADSEFPTRGRGFLFLQKQGGKYVPIAAFRGGFILTRSDMKNYFNIQIFEKEYGEMYFYELGFKGGKYRFLFETKLARTIYDAEFYERWKVLNSLSCVSC